MHYRIRSTCFFMGETLNADVRGRRGVDLSGISGEEKETERHVPSMHRVAQKIENTLTAHQ